MNISNKSYFVEYEIVSSGPNTRKTEHEWKEYTPEEYNEIMKKSKGKGKNGNGKKC